MKEVAAFVLGLVVAGLMIGVGVAQAQPADPGLEAMRGVGFLVGHWEGEGSVRQGPGDPVPFKSKETIESRLDGRILTVEGLHHSAASPERVVHHAFAVISYDAAAGHYRFHSYLADGHDGDYPAELKDGAFVWAMEHPQAGHIRYTIRAKDGRWVETGESSRDRVSWTRFFEMTLARKD
jgi:hypothetical protein